MYNILICDDDKYIVKALKIYLNNPEYNIFEAFNGKEALEIIGRNEIHLVLMDIMMPVADGLQTAEKIREKYNMPIIFLTAKSEDNDKITGLEVGGDDYITKPFQPAEVCARVRSQLRRYLRLGGIEKKPHTITIGGITLDPDSKKVTVDGEPVQLTSTQYTILKLFMENPGKTFSSKEIYHHIWNEDTSSPGQTIAVHIRHLRKKIEINPEEPIYIKVLWGHGYVFGFDERGNKT